MTIYPWTYQAMTITELIYIMIIYVGPFIAIGLLAVAIVEFIGFLKARIFG